MATEVKDVVARLLGGIGSTFDDELTLSGDEARSVASLLESLSSQSGHLSGDGYVFLNPDTGVEYSRNHPVQSGECDDAEDVRRSTHFEDGLARQLHALTATNATLTEGCNSARADHIAASQRADAAESRATAAEGRVALLEEALTAIAGARGVGWL